MTEQENTEVEIKDPKAVLDALERAKSDAKKHREAADALQAEIEGLKESAEAMRAQIESYESGDSEWKSRTKELLIKDALDTKSAGRVMKFLDLDSIDFDEDGKLTGLDEAVSRVKADLPELFDSKKRVGGEADLFEKGEAPKKPTGTEAQVARIFANS
jgi:hypothetical protein